MLYWNLVDKEKKIDEHKKREAVKRKFIGKIKNAKKIKLHINKKK